MPSCLFPTFPLVALFLMGDVVRALRDMRECLFDLDGVEGGQGILLSPVREMTLIVDSCTDVCCVEFASGSSSMVMTWSSCFLFFRMNASVLYTTASMVSSLCDSVMV